MLKLSDEQWERIREHFPEEHIPPSRPGRKPIPTRKVLEAVLWILNTGAQWHMLPQCYPNYKTVHRRFQGWCRNDVLREAMTDLANMQQVSRIGVNYYQDGLIMTEGGGAIIGDDEDPLVIASDRGTISSLAVYDSDPASDEDPLQLLIANENMSLLKIH